MTPETQAEFAEWLKGHDERWALIANFWMEYAKALEAELVALKGEHLGQTKH